MNVQLRLTMTWMLPTSVSSERPWFGLARNASKSPLASFVCFLRAAAVFTGTVILEGGSTELDFSFVAPQQEAPLLLLFNDCCGVVFAQAAIHAFQGA